jgi:flagellar basal body rod protein FlgG
LDNVRSIALWTADTTRACAGLRARTQALEVVANNLANLNTSGYSSSQVDQRKVGKLATAIQTAFQQLGVLPGTDKIICGGFFSAH